MNPRDEGLGARLRALPLFEPPAGGWMALERRRRRDQRRFTGWAMAASVLLAVAAGGWQLRHAGGGSPGTAQLAMESPIARQSSALEHSLHQARQQAVVWDSDRAQRSAELEGQLAVVDLQISYADPKATDALWQDRVNLMNALVDTHRAAAAGSGDADGELVEY